MAAFQRVFRASIAPSVAFGAALAASATTAMADDGSSASQVRPGHAANGNKLPIYTSPDDAHTVQLVVVENPLVEYITAAREATTSAFGGVRSVVESGVSSWIGFERNVEHEVKQIVPTDESLTPGIIYVLVAGLTGSVLSRTRSFPVRFLAPPIFATAALPYFLPKTAHNLRKYISDVEDKHCPEFAARHDHFNQALELHWHMGVDKLRGAGDEARQWTSKAVDGVESATGLKVGEAVRISQERVEDVKEAARAKVAEVKAAAQSVAPTPEPVQVQKIATVIEQKPIAEIVVPVPAAEPVVAEVVAAPVEVVIAPVAVAEVPKTEAKQEAKQEIKPVGKEEVPVKKDDKKPRDVIARPVEDGGKRLV